MANPTTNIGMTKPTVGGSTDTWGTTINEEVVDIIDALFSISGTDVTMSDIKFNSVGLQETGAGTDTVKIQAPAAVTQYTLTMPGAVGSANQVLSASDGAGTLAWTTPEVGDITSVADATNGGMTVTNGTGPDVTLAVNLNDLSAAAVNVANDSIAILDADDSGTKKESIADLIAAIDGTGLTASSGVLAVDASQTQITGLGVISTAGEWQATTIAVAYGGTGATSLTDGGVLLGSGTGAITATSVLGDGEILIGDASGDPATLDVGSSTAITILGTVSTGVWNGTAIANAYLANSTVSYGGVSLALGASDATPAFNLADATGYPGDSSLVTVGTVASGTWNGSTVGVAYGGTGATTFTDGGVLLGSGTGAITATAVLGNGEILIGDASGDPTTLDVGSSTAITVLGTVVTGTWNATALATAYIADNAVTLAKLEDGTSGDILYYAASGVPTRLAKGSDTHVLTLSGGLPVWSASNVGDITNVIAGNGLTGGGDTGDVTLNVAGTTNRILVNANDVDIASTYVGQTSITTLGTIATGTWSATAVAGDKGGTGLTSYTAGDIIYATGSTTLAKLGVGSNTEVLTLAGGVPTWAAPTVGDITGVTAGTGLSGGGSSGDVTLNVDAAQTQITSVGTLTSITSSGALTVTGTGSHSIGGALNTTARLSLIGSWTSSGLYSEMIGTQHSGILTAATGDTDFQVGSKFGNNIVCQAASETVAVVAQAYFQEPAITQGGTTLPIAATVYIKDAPTEGTESAALYVASGDTVLKGNLGVGTTLRSDLHGAWSHIFLGEKGSLYSDNDTGAGGIDGMFLTDNLYLDSDTGAFAYIETNQASYVKQEAGALTFANAASGTGGAAATLTTRLTVSADGLVLVNETANSDMTQGITINQGSADDEILAFKSSDVNQPSTNYAEADTYGFVSKAAADYGGLKFGAFTDTGTDGQTFYVYAVNADAANVTKATNGEGLVQFDAAVNSGTGSAVVGTDGNMVAFTNNGNARFLFDAEGSGHADVEWTTFSDARLKTNVEASPYGLTQVRDIEAKIFDKWSGKIVGGAVVLEEDSDRRMVGFIAQDVKAEMPELVKALPDDESFYSMDYGRLTPILWSAVKELDATVQSLEARIVALEA